ncbi:hypothetical protein ACFL6N_08130, partial [Thermodesulfobacteriota bacterium]
HMRILEIMKIYIILFLAFIQLTGCRGNNSDNQTEISSLSLPDSIVILAPAEDDGALSSVSALSENPPYDQQGTDFNTDQTNTLLGCTHGTFAIEQANYLLCIINEMEYQNHINQEPYVVSFNYRDCYEKTYGGEVPMLEPFVIEAIVVSTRENDTAPQTIKAWWWPEEWSDEVGEVAPHLLLEVTIDESPSPANPFGIFRIDYAEVEDGALHDGVAGQEFITDKGSFIAHVPESGKPVYQFVTTGMNGETIDEDALTAVLTNAASNSGSVKFSSSEDHLTDDSEDRSAYTLFDFNDTNILFGESITDYDGTTEDRQCLMRDEYTYAALSAALYHRDDGVFHAEPVTAGQRVDITYFFLFRYQDITGLIYSPGIYPQFGEPLPDGAQIKGQPYGSSSWEDYTAHVTPGTLNQTHNIDTLLSALQDKALFYSRNHPVFGDCGSLCNWVLTVDENNEFQFTQIRKYINGAYQYFTTFDHDDNPATPGEPVATYLELSDGQKIIFSLKGVWPASSSGTYLHDADTPAATRTAILHNTSTPTPQTPDLFAPGTNSLTLYCYYNCPHGRHQPGHG